MINVKEHYDKNVTKALKTQFSYKNDLQIPRIVKVVVNRARKSIATFKVRKGMPVGVSVTLRGKRMYDFLAKLMHIALPRIKDFRGLSPKSFDGRGNYSLGIKEQLIFPEISYDKIDATRGMDIAIVTTARTDQEALALLKEIGMPFKK